MVDMERVKLDLYCRVMQTFVLWVCCEPLPPGDNPIAVNKYYYYYYYYYYN
jgi:hypothetical protein